MFFATVHGAGHMSPQWRPEDHLTGTTSKKNVLLVNENHGEGARLSWMSETGKEVHRN